jgi:hypothetical protein
LVHVPVPRHKLRVQWLGPFRVVDTVNEWVYVVEDILTQKRKTVHADMIKWYADRYFAVTEDLRNQIAYDSQFYVDRLVDWRETDEGTLEIRVRWLGLDQNEDSWEPAAQLREDVPETVQRYLLEVADECDLAGELLRQWGIAGAPAAPQQQRRRRRRAPAGRRR